MANDFLEKYDTRGMTLDELRALLGEPDFGPHAWMYNLSLDGPPPPGRQETSVYYRHPQLYVYFEGLRVHDVRVILADDLREGLTFDSEVWKTSDAPVRRKMSASLIRSGILKSSNKYDVRRILGNPDKEREEEQFEYSLGYRIIDLVTLSFTFDANGKVSEAKIFEH